MPSNQELLTRGDRKYAAKKKAKSGVEKVVFDSKARQEYLTGFHKRNLKRKEENEKKAKEFLRKQRNEERKAANAHKKEAIQKGLDRLEQAQKVFASAGSGISAEGAEESDSREAAASDEEFSGFSDNSGILKKTTTFDDEQVTIEQVRIDPYVDLSRNEEVLQDSTRKAQEYAKYVEGLEQPKKRKVKKKKFRYLSKGERMAERKKQRA